MAVPPRCHVCGYDMHDIPDGEDFSEHFTEVWFQSDPEQMEQYQAYARDWSGPHRPPGHYWFCFRHAALAVERKALDTRDALTEIRRIAWLDMHGSDRERYETTAEERFGYSFPEGYRTFLHETTGMTVEASIPGTSGGYLSEIYGLVDVMETNDDRRAHGPLAAVPANFIVIGGGPDGVLCLRIDESEKGSIWWAQIDRMGEGPHEGKHGDIMTRLAPDFESLMTTLSARGDRTARP